ncbi:MAG: acetyl-CoA carboxylase biotin carboxyl carrier protein subunit [Flavobacteriales bacterium]|nr:acetyl-CoA carboxylase biotin carboxyl carrier protein subunit [Flavobacteriales bacterium]MCB9205054.1 acetyl-CoA carboxylase biotin carboxyl carrier protein subunit [Flavobacteriales bacterium]
MSTRIKVSNKEFEVIFSDDFKTSGTLSGNAFNWDVSKISDSVFHLIKDDRSFNVEVLEPLEGLTRLKINGNVYEAEAVDQFDELLKKLGMEKGGAGKVNELKAPMPGLVLEISVQAGDTLKKGDRVLVLEAMKMENVIKAPADVTVSSIEVKQGSTVEKNQVMVRFA